ncbi:MAG TPA: EamA family transporter [Spirochaetia bacterium]|nr:EamA family transporter [Spirochaetia bacterium]
MQPEPAHAADAAPSRTTADLALAIGVAAVSSAAILVTLSRHAGVPALSIAAWRLGLASLVVLPVALVRSHAEIRALAGRDLGLALVSGVLLALHFGFWTASLDATSVMSSVVFVSTNPVFVAIASALVFRERLGAGTVVGIAVAIAGGALVGFLDAAQSGAASTRGDLLALAAAVCGSAYLLVGRTVRPRMSLPAYVGIVYPVAAVVLLAAVAVSGTSLALDRPRGLLWAAALAVGPQLIGHTAYNYALRHVSATLVTVTLLAEPVGATLLAIPVLDQLPSWPRAAGGVLILVGIFLAARSEGRAQKRRAEV